MEVKLPMSPAAAPASTVVGHLRARAQERPHSPFLADGTEEVTYAQADERSSRLAAGLAQAGVRRGDLIAVFMMNSIDYMLVTFALAKLGAAAVTVNTEYKGELLRYVLADAQTRLAIVDDELAHRILELDLDGLPLETLIVRGEQPATELPLSIAPLAGLEAGTELVEPVGAQASDLYMVIYTGGTTGPSKGVMISNGHCLAFAADWVETLGFTDRDVLYSPLPLFHGIAYILGAMATLITGARMHLRRRFSASRFWEDVRTTEATVAHLIFSIVPILLSRPATSDDLLHNLRAVYIGPSKLSADFEARFGCPIVEVYGQTETGIVTRGPLGQSPPGSCGRVNADRFEVRLVDENDHPVPTGEPGEIIVRPRHPDTMMLGYLNKDAATVETFRNLWHHSGDRARMDADGWLYFVDRAKDCIRRRGENISSYEIELVLGKHPQVAEVAAIPVPSELEEDDVKVCVVLTPGADLDAPAIHAYCIEHMPKFMVPRFIELRDSLPKTPSEKIEKYKLRVEGDRGRTPTSWDAEAARG